MRSVSILKGRWKQSSKLASFKPSIPRTSQCIVTRSPFSLILIKSRMGKSIWVKALWTIGRKPTDMRTIIIKNKTLLVSIHLWPKKKRRSSWWLKWPNFSILSVMYAIGNLYVSIYIQDVGWAFSHSQGISFTKVITMHTLHSLVWAKLYTSTIIFCNFKRLSPLNK